jgi:predicted transcriptional regulator
MMTIESELYCTRDSSGRFAPLMEAEQLKEYSRMTTAIRELDKQTRKEAHLLHFASQLLYILVDFFEKPYVKEAERYSYYDLRRFPRKRYHDVLMVHPVSRNRLMPSQSTPGLTQPSNVACASFCTLINRLEKKGWVRRIKDGRKLYLKITQVGLEKIKAYHDYFSLGII